MDLSAPTIFGFLPALPKETFNSLSGQKNLPFLITGKLTDPRCLTPDHLEFIDESQIEKYVQEGRFTQLFEQAYRDMVETKRKGAVAQSLGESRSIVIIKDLSHLPESEKTMIRHLVVVSQKITELYQKQLGSYPYAKEIEKVKDTDPYSYNFFQRNQGPWSEFSNSDNGPFIHALPTFNKKRVAVYPADVELDNAFFTKIQESKELSSPWTVVVKDDSGTLKAVPYHEYYKEEMSAIADELEKSAQAIQENSDETALYEYLKSAAKAFRDGSWDDADYKWVAMNMQNSKYALRVAPDETYWEPGNIKSSFEFSLAMIDSGAAEFAKKLAPYTQEMEQQFQVLVPAYTAREIKFEVPDFVEMILATGDHHMAIGAIIGQKLPNFNDKISRMMVMTNYYTDDLSAKFALEKAALLLTPDSAKNYIANKNISTTNTLLHEMTHSFGVRGSNFQVKNPDGTVFLDGNNRPVNADKKLGGPNAQVMEELKAQTGALYWIGWFKEKGMISDEMATQLYTDCIIWAFGHISKGMQQSNGSPKTYSQLAGIQIRHLLKSGALTFEEDKFRINYEKMHASAEELFKTVIEIQTFGDAARAQALRDDVCSGEGFEAIRVKEIQKLYAPYPMASFELKVSGLEE